jgi:putative ABC transport system permease protein
MSIVLTVTGAASDVARSVRDAVARVDPDVPAGELRMLDELLASTVARPWAASLIGGVFAALALLVAAAGIYGLLSYSVESRTREIGIRSALGANRAQLTHMVLAQSTQLMVWGLALGWIAALLAGKALSGVIFGVRVWDPASLILATLLLWVAGTAAAWLPARRALSIDPRDALRSE